MYSPDNNQLKVWLAQFLHIRGHTYPNGRPLYTYQVSSIEFNELREKLSTSHHAFHPIFGNAWAAGFCLFIAEWYRRKYDANWSWSEFEKQVNDNFNSQQRAELVTKGLKNYWKRPIRECERGRDLLGSLFLEGGLPWPLLQRDNHVFGRAVRIGLKNFYSTKSNHHTITNFMAELNLPQTFNNSNTPQLLAGIVEQLMLLVELYPIKEQKDPTDYLDKHANGWRSDFPIPLDEENARSLINDWLKDADSSRQEYQNAQKKHEKLNKEQIFTCEHFLQYDTPLHWRIMTKVTLPVEKAIPIDINQLSSTRLELGFYEGERLIVSGEAVYGRVENNQLKIRFFNQQVTLLRECLSKPVAIRLLENGRTIYRFYFNESAWDLDAAPLIFQLRNDDWILVANASCNLSDDLIRIRLPADFVILKGCIKELDKEYGGASWIESNEDLYLRGRDELYVIKLNQVVNEKQKPELIGNFIDFESIPNIVFKGWPTLKLPTDYEYKLDELNLFINGEFSCIPPQINSIGLIHYCLKSKQGNTLLQQSFGVLPEDFSFSINTATDNQPAFILIRSERKLKIQAYGVGLSSKIINLDKETKVYLTHQHNKHPTFFTLSVSSQTEIESVNLELPYPFLGARLIDGENKLSFIDQLILDDLLGMRIALLSGLQYDQYFTLQLELISPIHPKPRRRYFIKVGKKPELLNLFFYLSDMIQLLGATNNQDAYIHLTLDAAGEQLLSKNIRRYNGYIQFEGCSRFTICNIGSDQIKDSVKAEAMLLSDPKQKPIQLDECTSEGVGTGYFCIPNIMKHYGPWLLYPATNSLIKFRPKIFISNKENAEQPECIYSVHQAARLYHPEKNPFIIDEQIVAMTKNLNHSGWSYLSDLKQNFSHLPLSSFESWLSLSRNPDALAIAVLRLELDEAFCNRISNELAILWDSIPLSVWISAYINFRDWLSVQGYPQALIESIEENRKIVLRRVISVFDHLGDYLITGNIDKLKLPPVDVLHMWYQDLRRNHAFDNNWPTILGAELSFWIKKQELPSSIKSLSVINDSDAVTYLPIFMAYVAVGKTNFHSLGYEMAFLKFAIRKISEFDRDGWYACVHALMVSYLLTQKNGE
ncbi:TPA: STY4851/ECs_5259 family protein [Legionella pneumophila]